MGTPSPVTVAWLKAAVFALCLLPLATLAADGLLGALGANPIETVIRSNGEWALRLLLATLAITPLRRLTGWRWPMRLRRMLGLFAFFYACLHLLAYLVLDQFFDWAAVGRDLLERPFIALGMAAFLLLVPLAATSSDRTIQWLGGRRWRRLHRLIYPAAVLAVVHHFLLVKADLLEPIIHALVLALLLGIRLMRPGLNNSPQAPI